MHKVSLLQNTSCGQVTLNKKWKYASWLFGGSKVYSLLIHVSGAFPRGAYLRSCWLSLQACYVAVTVCSASHTASACHPTKRPTLLHAHFAQATPLVRAAVLQHEMQTRALEEGLAVPHRAW